MKPVMLAAGLFLVCAVPAASQPATVTSQGAASPPPAEWAFSASVWTYALPEADNYAQPTVTADRGTLHLEARYNYEGLHTGSVWVGCNFAGGDTVTWELTPIVGGVFGDATGVAPGYKGSLSWWKVTFYSEGEYVFDAGGSSDSFFFNWSELTIRPVDWFRGGLATQRTRVYQTDRDLQRGIVLAATYKNLDVAAYLLNPDRDRPTVIVAVALGW